MGQGNLFEKAFEKDFLYFKKDKERFCSLVAKEFLFYKNKDDLLDKRLGENISELVIKLGGDTFLSDGMLLWGRELGWIYDEDFLNSLIKANPREKELQVCWRTHILCWAAMQASKSVGDFFEFGCYKGFSASVIRNYCDVIFNNYPTKKYYWFDIFSSLNTDKNLSLDHSSSEILAHERASLFSNVEVLKGNVLNTYLDNAIFLNTPVAFAHFDLNTFDVELQVLEKVMNNVNSRSVLVFDDFGMIPFRNQNREYRDYFSKKSIPILELPTGQGVVIIP